MNSFMETEMARQQHDSEKDATRPAVTGRPNPSRMRRVAQAQENALSKGSQILYYKHWKAFNDWCYDNSFRALPAHVDTICAYLTERADNKTKVSTLGPVLAAIRHYHEAVELTSPTTTPRVKKTLKGLAREYPCKPVQVTALDQEACDAIFEAADIPKSKETPHQTAKRAAFDKALISFSRDVLARPETTAAAERRHIEETPEGKYVLFIPHSKTDQAHEGVYAYLTANTMELLDEMFATRKRETKPTDKIFGISERQISNRIQAAAKHAGLEGDTLDAGLEGNALNARFRGHSPRIGMAVDLTIDGSDMPALKQAGRWKSHQTVSRYIENIVATRNAVALREAENDYDDDDLYDDEDFAA